MGDAVSLSTCTYVFTKNSFIICSFRGLSRSRVVDVKTSLDKGERQECCASASRYGKYYIIERLPSDIRGHAASINDSTLKDFLVKPAQLTLPPDLFEPKESRKNESKSSK